MDIKASIERDDLIGGTGSLYKQYGPTIEELKALCVKYELTMSEAIQIQRNLTLSVALSEISGILRQNLNK
jgi:hypothetical protein